MKGRLCKVCRRCRPFAEFVWVDEQNGRSGVSERCEGCRNRGKKPEPGLPALRHPITRHAVERYIERVRPDIAELPRGDGFRMARREMRVKMAYAEWSREWPSWAERDMHRDETVGLLLIDPDTVFVLSSDPNGERVVVTVLTRVLEREAA